MFTKKEKTDKEKKLNADFCTIFVMRRKRSEAFNFFLLLQPHHFLTAYFFDETIRSLLEAS